MTLISLIVALIILGVALYIVNLIPMDGTIKKIINIIVILFVCLWVLQSLGLIGSISHIGIK